ncbi:MAG: hypothetical protein NTX05_08020 [Fusobacteria bacterium]|nr:hypothetical protein [Fusobacteriota bacterium]
MGKPKLLKAGYWKEQLYQNSFKKFERNRNEIVETHSSDILVVVGGGLGDTIMQLPVVLELMKNYKQGKVYVTMQPRFTPHYHKMGIETLDYTLSNNMIKRIKVNKVFLEKVYKKTFKYALHLGGHSDFLRIINLDKFISAERWIGSGAPLIDLSEELQKKTVQIDEKSILGDFRKYLFEVFQDEKYLSDFQFTIEWPEKEENSQEKYVVIGVGSSDRTHILEVSKLSEFLNILLERVPKYQVLLLGAGEEQEKYADRVLEALQNKNVVNLVNKSSLLNTFRLINGAEFFIGMDSGLYNIAAIIGRPTIGFFSQESKYEHKELSSVRTLIGNEGESEEKYEYGITRLNSISCDQFIKSCKELNIFK